MADWQYHIPITREDVNGEIHVVCTELIDYATEERQTRLSNAQPSRYWKLVAFVSGIVLLSLVLARGCSGQDFVLPSPSSDRSLAEQRYELVLLSEPHRFFDRSGKILTATHLTMAGLDAWRTQYNVCRPSWEACGPSSGVREWNPFMRPFVHSGNAGVLATGFALQASGQIALAYTFHKTGHHKMERMTQFVSIGFSTAGFATSARSWNQ